MYDVDVLVSIDGFVPGNVVGNTLCQSLSAVSMARVCMIFQIQRIKELPANGIRVVYEWAVDVNAKLTWFTVTLQITFVIAFCVCIPEC